MKRCEELVQIGPSTYCYAPRVVLPFVFFTLYLRLPWCSSSNTIKQRKSKTKFFLSTMNSTAYMFDHCNCNRAHAQAVKEAISAALLSASAIVRDAAAAAIR
jgi:hypothetical protein